MVLHLLVHKKSSYNSVVRVFFKSVVKSFFLKLNVAIFMRSGFGSVGRVVASDNRGPRFKSSHRRNCIHILTINCIEKTKIKKKEAGNGPILRKEKNLAILNG